MPVDTHVLILCTHNSARSVLAEAMLNHWAGRQALGYRMLQLLALRLSEMREPELRRALAEIGRS